MTTMTETIYRVTVIGYPGECPDAAGRVILDEHLPASERGRLIQLAREVTRLYVERAMWGVCDDLDLEALRAGFYGRLVGAIAGHLPDHDASRVFAEDHVDESAYVTQIRVHAEEG